MGTGNASAGEATHVMKPLRALSRAPALPLTLALFLAACGSPFTEAPPVADSTFVSALAELHLAEARLRSDPGPRQQPSDTMRVTLPPGVRDSILAQYGIRYRSFRTTLSYYVRHPEQYAELYARVVDTLRTERETLRLGEGRSRPPPNERAVPEAFRNRTERD